MFLEHVNLTVSNLDRTIDFYSSLLGLEIRWRRDGSSADQPAAHIGDGRCYLAIFEARKDAETGPRDY